MNVRKGELLYHQGVFLIVVTVQSASQHVITAQASRGRMGRARLIDHTRWHTSTMKNLCPIGEGLLPIHHPMREVLDCVRKGTVVL